MRSNDSLYRLGRSPYRDKFVIKGATLFTLWTGETHRPTKDLDMLGWGSSAISDVEETIRAICKVEESDGIRFDGESVEGARIKEEDEYEWCPCEVPRRSGRSANSDAGRYWIWRRRLSRAGVRLVSSAPADGAPLIRAYPREAAIAEKFNAMVVLDIRNSRMKDFYDIWFMANTWTFDLAPVENGHPRVL
jgi:predicted nucleotidyltransferase component of viral defense system